MRRWMSNLLVTTLAACAVPASAAAQPMGEGAMPRRGPLELLLAHRDTLRLSPHQLARIDRVRERLSQQNEPFVRRMMALRAEWQAEQMAGRRSARRPDPVRLQRIRHDVQPLHERIQSNNRAAMQVINQVLTPMQRARLREIVQQNRRTDSIGWRPDVERL